MTAKRVLLYTLLVALLAATAVGAALVLYPASSTNSSPVAAGPVEPATASGLSAEFKACANGVMTYEVMADPGVEDCVIDVMKRALDASAVMQLNEAIIQTERAHPAFFANCHDAGHKAGRYFYEQNPDISARLTENASSACQYTIGHGILDGFAASKPPLEKFREAAATCEALVQKDPSAYGLCADGLGHVAWASTHSVPDAVERCDVFAGKDAKEACGEGVIMQIFEPAGFLPSGDIARAPEELPEMCESWTTSSKELRKGCYKGAGYIYTRPAWVLQADWTSRNGTAVPDREAGDKLVEVMAKAADQCRAHPTEEAVSGCLYSISQQTPHIAYLDPNLLDRVCETQGNWAERCRTWRHVTE